MILFLASFESYYSQSGTGKYTAVNLVLVTFLLQTLLFVASNFLFIMSYRKLKNRFDHKASTHGYEEQIQVYQEKLSSLINSLQEGILILDNDGKILKWNKVAEKCLGVKFHARNNCIFDQVNDKNGAIIEMCYTLVRKSIDSGCTLKDSVRIGDNKQIYLELIASPIVSQPRVILILQDNTNAHKISELGKDFVANASHELRTPVTIIEGFAETLRDLPTVSDIMLEDMTDKIIRSCHRMNNLVKNLLMLAGLDNSTKPNLNPCDIVSLFESVSYSLLAIHPEVCIETLQNHDIVMINADVDLLEQALINLFENAVKYSKGAAHITVTIKKEGPRVTLQIEDRGIGIPQEHLDHIFDRFYRVNQDRSRKLGGTGLGLSIVHSIIEKHHGEIKVTSVEGVGTTFTIKLLSADESLCQSDIELSSSSFSSS
ncbi:MAG: ATP-binding protein [Rhabdochlamydiaceae bacterium]|nr:ATP-binding protein [Candidatus Amphrikana amoebophyrae]